MSKRWPWPCKNCDHPCHEHILLEARKPYHDVQTKAAHLKCPFAASRYRGYTALEFVNKMADATTNDRAFFSTYGKRLHAALEELEADIVNPNLNRQISRAHLLRHKAIL